MKYVEFVLAVLFATIAFLTPSLDRNIFVVALVKALFMLTAVGLAMDVRESARRG